MTQLIDVLPVAINISVRNIPPPNKFEITWDNVPVVNSESTPTIMFKP